MAKVLGNPVVLDVFLSTCVVLDVVPVSKYQSPSIVVRLGELETPIIAIQDRVIKDKVYYRIVACL